MDAEAARPARRKLLVAGALFAATLVLYGRTYGHEFVNLDDPEYVQRNPHVARGLDAEAVSWAWSETYQSNWHPLTWMSHMLDVELHDLEPGGHHLTNVMLHALSAVLLLLALARLTGELWPSAFVAAVFALHPLHVESVAWIAERKDVLAGLFWNATLLAYAGWAHRPGAGRYGLVLLSFALGLAAKPMLVTLPFVLLLLDVWPLRRWQGTSPDGTRARTTRDLVVEKLPLFLLAAAACIVTVVAQRGGGAVRDLESLPLDARVANACVSVAVYAWQAVWPAGLAVFYPHPALVAPESQAPWNAGSVGAALLVLATCTLAWRQVRLRPSVFVGWFWYLGTLIPVVGLVQVGAQAHADRYTYLPLIGLTLAATWGARAALGGTQHGRRLLAFGAALSLALFFGVSWRQVGTWQSSTTLFTHALEVTERNYVAHTHLARAHETERRFAEAAAHHAEAALILPRFAPLHYNHGRALALLAEAERQGPSASELEGAVAAFARALELEPDYLEARLNLALVLERQGRDALALAELRQAERLAPGSLAVLARQAWLLATSPDDTVRDAGEALRIAQAGLGATGGRDPTWLETEAAALAALGRHAEAVRSQERALERIPPARAVDARARLALYRAGKDFRRGP